MLSRLSVIKPEIISSRLSEELTKRLISSFEPVSPRFSISRVSEATYPSRFSENVLTLSMSCGIIRTKTRDSTRSTITMASTLDKTQRSFSFAIPLNSFLSRKEASGLIIYAITTP